MHHGIYAPQSSLDRAGARLWDNMATYPWLSNALVCGDFNNSPLPTDNTTGISHMSSSECHSWHSFMSQTECNDLWKSFMASSPRFTYKHNALSHYWARLDRWYMLNTRQVDLFSCKLWIDYATSLSDHSPLWLAMYFYLPISEPSLQDQRSLLVNNSYLKHDMFRALVYDAISPLSMQIFEDIDYAWFRFV